MYKYQKRIKGTEVLESLASLPVVFTWLLYYNRQMFSGIFEINRVGQFLVAAVFSKHFMQHIQ